MRGVHSINPRRTVSWIAYRTTRMTVLLTGAALLQGCIVIAGAAAYKAIKSNKSGNMETAQVQLGQSADEVYRAEARVLAAADLKIVRSDPKEHRIEAMKGSTRVVVDADPVAGGHSTLTVTAMAPEGMDAPDHVALDLEKRICDELGVRYNVVTGAEQ